MTRSMTAYGRETFNSGKHHFTLELHSLNKKGLDISVYMPKELMFLDIEVRKWTSNIVKRGQLTVRLIKECSAKAGSLLPDIEALKNLKVKIDEIVKELDLSKEQTSLEFLFEQLEKAPEFSEEDFDQLIVDFKKSFEKASKKFLEMKNVEGKALSKDIKSRLQTILEVLVDLEKESESEPENYKEKLKQKIERLESFSEEVEEKIAREVVLFADKVNISEELARLKSHVSQFLEKLALGSENIGKTLDFLTLEMIRETNTILAKTSKLEVTNYGLSIKAELEKIREQVQNIE